MYVILCMYVHVGRLGTCMYVHVGRLGICMYVCT